MAPDEDYSTGVVVVTIPVSKVADLIERAEKAEAKYEASLTSAWAGRTEAENALDRVRNECAPYLQQTRWYTNQPAVDLAMRIIAAIEGESC